MQVLLGAAELATLRGKKRTFFPWPTTVVLAAGDANPGLKAAIFWVCFQGAKAPCSLRNAYLQP
jgi:hypothetical protein